MSLPHQPKVLSQIIGKWSVWIGAILVLFFLMVPILAIIPLSFSSGTFLTYPLPGFSLRWYEELLTSDKWLPALRNSMIIGTSATFASTVLGTLAALGMNRANFAFKQVVMGVLLSLASRARRNKGAAA